MVEECVTMLGQDRWSGKSRVQERDRGTGATGMYRGRDRGGRRGAACSDAVQCTRLACLVLGRHDQYHVLKHGALSVLEPCYNVRRTSFGVAGCGSGGDVVRAAQRTKGGIPDGQ